MPKKKKKLTDLKTEDVMKKLFPSKAIEKAKETAHEKDNRKPLKRRK